MKRLCAALLIGLLIAIMPTGIAEAVGGDEIGAGVSAASPSPSLGSTPQPGVEQSGDNDGDAADFSQVPLAFAGLAIVVIVLGSVAFYLRRRQRSGSNS
ncbi:hypothetical protein FB561_5241 [Kribbella amoyensis]|uniref:LPXTG-motif cell wall-anchored protein n=1 Tax=Kribbella amoyensis TaxID=996641 RepID=A0A561BZ07_9ACTN|nr:hypothetical protein [Kribbella amoyensis]TWD84068.1 hypothetical protein FB561_5241 [Kribbella amoyensis]